MTEHETQNAIIRSVGKEPWCRIARVNTGVFRVVDKHGRKSMVRSCPNGTPDICGFIRGKGTFLGIEVKGPKGKQSPAQKAMERTITQGGGIYILARSVEDVYEALRQKGYLV